MARQSRLAMVPQSTAEVAQRFGPRMVLIMPTGPTGLLSIRIMAPQFTPAMGRQFTPMRIGITPTGTRTDTAIGTGSVAIGVSSAVGMSLSS
jgi:hypothetical protein